MHPSTKEKLFNEALNYTTNEISSAGPASYEVR